MRKERGVYLVGEGEEIEKKRRWWSEEDKDKFVFLLEGLGGKKEL